MLTPNLWLTAAVGMIAALGAVNAQAAETRKEARLDIASGGTLNVVNNCGSVILRGGAGKQAVIAYTLHSDKVEVDQSLTADKRRIELVTHPSSAQRPTPEEARVDFEITVPAGVAVSVNTGTAPIAVDGLSGDLSLSSDTGQVTVRNVARVHVQVRGVTAPVSLTNVSLAHVEVTSSGGAVDLVDVAGPKVYVGTTSGNISYRGDCSGSGQYSFTTHSGAIEVTLPETASFDLSARSINGSVENDFPLTEKAHNSFVPKAGRSFAGTSNSGSSSVELQSFSGRIRVKKQ
jgi:hypothetical protein